MATFKVRAYNTFGMGECDNRIVSATQHDSTDARQALDTAEILARRWNRTEKRPNMTVKFITCEGLIRAL